MHFSLSSCITLTEEGLDFIANELTGFSQLFPSILFVYCSTPLCSEPHLQHLSQKYPGGTAHSFLLMSEQEIPHEAIAKITSCTSFWDANTLATDLHRAVSLYRADYFWVMIISSQDSSAISGLIKELYKLNVPPNVFMARPLTDTEKYFYLSSPSPIDMQTFIVVKKYLSDHPEVVVLFTHQG